MFFIFSPFIKCLPVQYLKMQLKYKLIEESPRVLVNRNRLNFECSSQSCILHQVHDEN